MKKILLLLNVVALLFVTSCKKQEETNSLPETKKIRVRTEPKTKTITYQFENTKKWLSQEGLTDQDLQIAYAINRTDQENLKLMDSIVIPQDRSGDLEFYMPFPLDVPALKDVDKLLFFSYPTQTFAAYENGELVRTGPTNMGREKDQTPTGLFFTNWKAEETTSTFNDEWDLKWNFNIANKLGVGFHQYSLPGYPASHSCLRLQEKDAKFLYEWADQWELSNPETVKVKGTAVIVFGSYNFDAPKPWLQLVNDYQALAITDSELEAVIKPFMPSILKEQKNRFSFESKANKN
jgi:hypothetical protein